MRKDVQIPVPAAFQEDPDEFDLVDYFNGFLADELGEYSGELVRALDTTAGRDYDDRAQLDALEVVNAAVAPDGSVTVECAAEFSAHYGCDDMSSTWIENDIRATGTLVGGFWVFPVHVPLVELSPNEEL